MYMALVRRFGVRMVAAIDAESGTELLSGPPLCLRLLHFIHQGSARGSASLLPPRGAAAMAGESMMIKVHSLNPSNGCFRRQEGRDDRDRMERKSDQVPPSGPDGHSRAPPIHDRPAVQRQIPVTHLLRHYLEFMHGAEVRLFDVNDPRPALRKRIVPLFW